MAKKGKKAKAPKQPKEKRGKGGKMTRAERKAARKAAKPKKYAYDVAVSLLGGVSCVGLFLLLAIIAFAIVSAILF